MEGESPNLNGLNRTWKNSWFAVLWASVWCLLDFWPMKWHLIEEVFTHFWLLREEAFKRRECLFEALWWGITVYNFFEAYFLFHKILVLKTLESITYLCLMLDIYFSTYENNHNINTSLHFNVKMAFSSENTHSMKQDFTLT